MGETVEDYKNLLMYLVAEAANENGGGLLTICLLALTILSVEEDLHKIRPSCMYPPAGFYPSGSADPFWKQHEDLFFFKFRFRLEHFHQMLRAMDFVDQTFKCGAVGKKYTVRADVCLLVVLRRLSYPVRFWDLVEDFGIPSHKLCEIFHTGVDIIFERFHAIVEFSTWLPFFQQFSQIMKEYKSPYDDLVALTDGKFLGSCRPGGLGNRHSRLDQSQLYTGEKACHGIKHLGAFFPNGMMALCGPFLGSVHDGRMIRESGWIEYLRLISQFDGRRYKIFGDSAFGCTNYVQSMIKGELTPEGRAFNALMSRIRINIENAFGENSNTFTFLAFHRGIKIGGRNTQKLYKVATILMNMRCTFYGCQFTDQLGHPLRMTIEELLQLCKP